MIYPHLYPLPAEVSPSLSAKMCQVLAHRIIIGGAMNAFEALGIFAIVLACYLR